MSFHALTNLNKLAVKWFQFVQISKSLCSGARQCSQRPMILDWVVQAWVLFYHGLRTDLWTGAWTDRPTDGSTWVKQYPFGQTSLRLKRLVIIRWRHQVSVVKVMQSHCPSPVYKASWSIMSNIWTTSLWNIFSILGTDLGPTYQKFDYHNHGRRSPSSQVDAIVRIIRWGGCAIGRP